MLDCLVVTVCAFSFFLRAFFTLSLISLLSLPPVSLLLSLFLGRAGGGHSIPRLGPVVFGKRQGKRSVVDIGCVCSLFVSLFVSLDLCLSPFLARRRTGRGRDGIPLVGAVALGKAQSSMLVEGSCVLLQSLSISSRFCTDSLFLFPRSGVTMSPSAMVRLLR